MRKWRVGKAVSSETVEADIVRFETGGILAFYRLAPRTRIKTLVKAFARHAWVTVEEQDG